MAERWGELGQADGPYIISEAAYQFMRLFTCESMIKLTQPMLEIVADAFLQWGIRPENYDADTGADADADADADVDPAPDGDARAEKQDVPTPEQLDARDDAERPKNKKRNGKGKKNRGNGQGKQGNPYTRKFVGQAGYNWYTGAGGPKQQQGMRSRVVVDLFKDTSTELKPHEWQLLYYPADQCTALDIGRPTKLSVALPETL